MLLLNENFLPNTLTTQGLPPRYVGAVWIKGQPDRLSGEKGAAFFSEKTSRAFWFVATTKWAIMASLLANREEQTTGII
ncbi:hypothetical protein D4764_17G0008810 [Takifugu flavidus]|uniref:Uncharacterized protein n=1 Tax=Takifugu flavidus TaxID=433684 RepID=A0A5C6NX57_9TELE|nr:hypothetical protein D4764_17G0008810 [Takifugu flavidus]